MTDFKKKKNIFQLVVWIVALVAGCVLAGIICSHEGQFICAVIYGYSIMSFVVAISMFVDEKIPKKTGLTISGAGFVLYVVAVILLFLEKPFNSSAWSIRVLVAAILSIVNAVMYGVIFFFTLLKEKELEDTV